MKVAEPTKVLLGRGTRAYLELQKGFLDRHDVEILTTPEGSEVLRTAREHRPDVVVLDDAYRGSPAPALCRQLKRDRSTAVIPVVLITGSGRETAARGAGADSWVLKPITEQSYVQALARCVTLRARSHVRYLINLRFVFRLGNHLGQAFSRNLSSSGVFLNTELEMRPGTELDLSFHVPGAAYDIRCRGTVRHFRPQEKAGPRRQGVGVEFSKMESRDLAVLRTFIEQHTARSPARRGSASRSRLFR